MTWYVGKAGGFRQPPLGQLSASDADLEARKVKVKSYTRRTKKGKSVRVKESGRSIAEAPAAQGRDVGEFERARSRAAQMYNRARQRGASAKRLAQLSRRHDQIYERGRKQEVGEVFNRLKKRRGERW